MNSTNPVFNFANLTWSGSMTSECVLERLYHYAKESALHGHGVVVEVGAYRGASTVALAMGLQDAGHGKVHSIDPHKNYRGVLGGVFSPDDHIAYEALLKRYGVESWVAHYCCESAACATSWTGAIDLIWLDGDHSYEGVAMDLKLWLSFLADGGILILDDHSPDSEVEAAVRDHLPFSRYIPIERIGNTLVLRKTVKPRTLVLCGGMQSSGSTLVSMCFLQRKDLDGVYDLDNPLIQQDFSRVFTDMVWVKMTIGSFRLAELVDLYRAQGWQVWPILITRTLEDILQSLVGKWYGLDGCTADDPPLRVRIMRYVKDIQEAESSEWVIINYEDFIKAPEAALRQACDSLALPWDERMLTWPVPESDFAYPSLGNESLKALLSSGRGLLETILAYTKRRNKTNNESNPVTYERMQQLLAEPQELSSLLPPCRYRGTRKNNLERQAQHLEEQTQYLIQYINKLSNHIVIGRMLRFWVKYVNPNLLRFKTDNSSKDQ